MKFRCIRDHDAHYSIGFMCEVLEVTRSGYYAWKARKPSARAQQDAGILAEMKAVHKKSNATYGVPRLHAQLHKNGLRIGRKRVRRLMLAGSIVVKTRRRFKATTNSKHKHPVAENLLDRKVKPEEIGRLNRCYAGDITYIWTDEGWLYLAVVIDLFSRRVIGWSMSQSMESSLVTDALRMAFERRSRPHGVMYHTDRGSQYAGDASRKLLKQYAMTASMSRKANCWDNAVVESWNATLKTELIHRYRWATREEARSAVFKYIEIWYNSERLHSTLGYRSPAEFEEQEKFKAA